MLLEELFKTDKPIIGVVHLKPLPGSPEFEGSWWSVVEAAERDAIALYEGGVDGIIIENYGDSPYYPDTVPPHTIACITYAASCVARLVDLPIGISVLRNDAISALSIAHAVGASFIRVNVLHGAMITEQGVIVGKPHELMRLKNLLRSEVSIFADVMVKHAYPLSPRFNAEVVARETIERCGADAVIITGRATGEPPTPDFVDLVKSAVGEHPLLVGSGVNEENVERFLSVSDGAIIGTYFKQQAVTTNPVDVERVSKLMELVRRIRGG